MNPRKNSNTLTPMSVHGLSLCMALAICPSLLNAEPIVWSGPAGGSWQSSGNWDGSAIPTATDEVLISDATTGNISLGGQASYAHRLIFERAVSISGDGANAALYLSGGLSKTTTSGGVFISPRIELLDDISLSNSSGSGGSTLALTGDISDGGNNYGVIIDGGHISLRGNNTFSGGVTYERGTFQIQHNNALGTGTFRVISQDDTKVVRFVGVSEIGNEIEMVARRHDWYLDSTAGFNRGLTFTNTFSRIESTGNMSLRFYGVAGVVRFKEEINLGTTGTAGLVLGSSLADQSYTFIFSKNAILDSTGEISLSVGGDSGNVNLLVDQAISFDGMGRIVDSASTSGRGVNTIGGIHESGRAVIAPRTGIILNNTIDAAINLASLNQGAVTEFRTPIQDGTGAPVAVRINSSYRQVDTAQTSGANVVYQSQNPEGIVDLSNASGNTYRGGTTVYAGGLRVNNTSGSGTGTGGVIVNSGAFLGGAGIIAPEGSEGVVFQSGSTLAPGNDAFGTLRFSGEKLTGAPLLRLEAGADIEFKLGAPGTGDGVALLHYNSGDLELSDNVINFINAGGMAAGEYTLFTFYSDNGLTATASGITAGLVIGTGLEAFEGSYIRYGEHSIDLIVIPEASTWLLLIVPAIFPLLRRRRRSPVA